MKNLIFSLSILSAVALCGCSNSRLRKDFVSLFQAPLGKTSPFARPVEKAGEKIAGATNRASEKFDDFQDDEGKQLQSFAEKKAYSSKDAVKDEASQTKDTVKEKAKEGVDDVKSWWFS